MRWAGLKSAEALPRTPPHDSGRGSLTYKRNEWASSGADFSRFGENWFGCNQPARNFSSYRHWRLHGILQTSAGRKALGRGIRQPARPVLTDGRSTDPGSRLLLSGATHPAALREGLRDGPHSSFWASFSCPKKNEVGGRRTRPRSMPLPSSEVLGPASKWMTRPRAGRCGRWTSRTSTPTIRTWSTSRFFPSSRPSTSAPPRVPRMTGWSASRD